MLFICVLYQIFGHFEAAGWISSHAMLQIFTCASSEARHKFRFAPCFFFLNLCRGLHSLDVANADGIVAVIKDVILRNNLNLKNCRGQCYDGCSTMKG